MIKAEVLLQIQHAKTQVESEDKITVESEKIETNELKDMSGKKSEKRKRKISFDKVDRKDSSMPVSNKVNSKPKNISETNKNLKSFVYKNIDFKTFYDNTEKTHNHKQLKTKNKKFRK